MRVPPPKWLTVVRGAAPLVVSLPHTGTTIPAAVGRRLDSRWLALKDTDWYVERLYTSAVLLGATVFRTRVSRTAIDVNRDPSGASLYPGQATTELCPTTTFDGEPLYYPGDEPSAEEVAARRSTWFDPYHAVLADEVRRLREAHERIVVYDCHSIRSVIPRLFDGELPHFNIGTDNGRSCDPRLTADVEAVLADTDFTRVTNGRFRGGYITRRHGRPAGGVHAVQMELAMRGYLREPVGPVDKSNWPPAYDDTFAAPMRDTLRRVLEACLAFAA
ncbi:MAG: N-formylglutamate deformylase [Gemmataceae bacterium]|nr:N-formylglutamate deformylase [Gemmataceae bacterium]